MKSGQSFIVGSRGQLVKEGSPERKVCTCLPPAYPLVRAKRSVVYAPAEWLERYSVQAAKVSLLKEMQREGRIEAFEVWTARRMLDYLDGQYDDMYDAIPLLSLPKSPLIEFPTERVCKIVGSNYVVSNVSANLFNIEHKVE
jgi:hypothetical protein